MHNLIKKVSHMMFVRVSATLVMVALLLGVTMNFTTGVSLKGMELELLQSRLEVELQYIETELGDGYWNIDEDGILCKGATKIGDGTIANANIHQFTNIKQEYGTTAYVFIDCGTAPEGTAEDGTEYGHYKRVSGSSRGASGELIIGTYIDGKVSDTLDSEGYYSGEVSVNGNTMYGIYRAIEDENGNVLGALSVGATMEEAYSHSNEVMKTLSAILFGGLGIAVVLLTIYMFFWVDSIHHIRIYLKRIGEDDFPEEPLVLKSADELSDVADSINDMKQSLLEKRRMGMELSVAKEIQERMLPDEFPAFPDQQKFDVFATMQTAKEVGGDFYDFFMPDEKHVAFLVADVSGKGVPAALFMVKAKTLIKNQMMEGFSVTEAMTKVNRMLCEDNESGMFVTSWVGVCDIETGKLEFVCAGHNPPLLEHEGQYSYIRARSGLVLAGLEMTRYKLNEMTLVPGDRILLYTDGVTEANDVDNELYGEDRLEKWLNANPTLSLTDTLHGIKANMDEFTGDVEQFDDITMVIFEYRGDSAQNA